MAPAWWTGHAELACTTRTCATCAAYEPVSALEVEQHEAEIQQIVDDAFAGLCPECGEVCELSKSERVDLLVCEEHGVVMRACKRIGEP